MTLLVDAPALVAMMTGEPEAEALVTAMLADGDRLCCAIGLWEAACAVARKRTIPSTDAARALDAFVATFALRIAPIGAAEAALAIDAHARYGKAGGHPARLNMGDCFAYACARANDARLLYKGDDFAATAMAR